LRLEGVLNAQRAAHPTVSELVAQLEQAARMDARAS